MLPEAAVVSARNARGEDLIIEAAGRTMIVETKWAGAGFPRDVERALHQLEGYSDASKQILIVAESLSHGARRLLDERGISWASSDGAAHILLDGLWVVREGTPVRKPRSTELRSNARLTLAETLLVEAMRRPAHPVPSVERLVALSFLSSGSVSGGLSAFDAQEFTRREGNQRGKGARRVLADPGALLDAWSDNYRNSREDGIEVHSLERDPKRLAAVLARQIPDVVLGGRYAADQMAPYSTEIGRLRCYAARDVKFDGSLGPTIAPGAGRAVFFRLPPHVSTQSSEYEGVRLTSAVRTYGDLLREDVRGEESARHLRYTTIGF